MFLYNIGVLLYWYLEILECNSVIEKFIINIIKLES